MSLLPMIAFEINKKTHPIACALLPAGFLVIPKEETYGCVVVMNQPVGLRETPLSGSGAVRRAVAGRLRYGGPQGPRGNQARIAEFENTWLEYDTFKEEFTSQRAENINDDFVVVHRKPIDPEATKRSPQFEGLEDDADCGNPHCRC